MKKSKNHIVFFLALMSVYSCQSFDSKKYYTEEEIQIDLKDEFVKNFVKVDTKNIDNDSLFGISIVEMANKKALKKSSNVKFHSSKIIYPSDFSFKVVNVYGDYLDNVAVKSFAESYVVNKKSIISTPFAGEVFHIKSVDSANFIFYIDDLTEKENSILIFNVNFKDDVIFVTEHKSKNSLQFQLLHQTSFDEETILDKSFFTENANNQALKSLGLDTVSSSKEYLYFLSDEKFVLKPIKNIDFKIYYRYKKGEKTEKYLRIENLQENTSQDILLAMNSTYKKKLFNFSEFLNDSIFIEKYVIEKEQVELRHITYYQTDTLISTYHYDKKFNFKLLNKRINSSIIEEPFYYEELKDSVFQVSGQRFTINKIDCYWNYHVRYEKGTNQDSKEIYVQVLKKNLLNAKTELTLLEGLQDFQKPINIKYLDETAPDAKEIIDINADGFKDFNIFCQECSTNGDAVFYTYLYKPKKQTFEYSEVFSGAEVFFNKSKRRVESQWKTGVDEFCYIYFNLKKENDELDFEENICLEGKNMTYTKKSKGRVLNSKNETISNLDSVNFNKYLERK
jgi:hypothetical protein